MSLLIWLISTIVYLSIGMFMVGLCMKKTDRFDIECAIIAALWPFFVPLAFWALGITLSERVFKNV